MATIARLQSMLRDRTELPLLATRLLGLFALQGVVVLALYYFMGPDTRSTDLPLGLQLDPRHGVLHLAVGLSALAIGFGLPRMSRLYVAAFGVAYTALAVLGTFTAIDFGMELELPENTLHWVLGVGALVVAWWSDPTRRTASQ